MLIEKLLSISSPPIAQGVAPAASLVGETANRGRFLELLSLLSAKNGFYAFEGALHVFPWIEMSAQNRCIGVQAWNEKGLWRDLYQGLVDHLFFFAEDAFGGGFALRDEEIVSFDPESGTIEPIASSLENWAGELLENFDQLTGYPVAHSWQLVHGPIPDGKRLLPKTPFILGGAYDEKNLYAVDAVKGMRYRGELWQQIRDLPDGARVRLKALPLQ